MLNFIAISQGIVFGSFTVLIYFGVFLTFLMPYFIVRILEHDYWKYYIKLMYLFAIIALVFWTLQNIFPSFTNLLENISSILNLDPVSNESIIIYNLEHSRATDLLGLMKNAGYTAEGGVYSCLLILALYFDAIFSKNIFE